MWYSISTLRLFFIGVILLIWPAHAQSHNSRCKYKEIVEQTDPTLNPSSGAPKLRNLYIAPESALATQPGATKKQADTSAEKSELNQWGDWFYLRREWFWPPIWSNWALAIAAIIGICVTVKTLKAIQRQGITMIQQSRIAQRQATTMEGQTKAAEDAAHAALQNIQILINKERARILIEPERIEIPKEGSGIFARAAGRPMSPIIYYKIFSLGTTPALVVDSSSQVEITTSSAPPVVREYTLPILELPSVIPTNTEGIHCVKFAFDRPRGTLDYIAEAISKREMFVHFWGFVSYKILFDNDVRWTRFRYVYGVKESFLFGTALGPEPSWWKAGPEEDNQET